jgi:BirA family biotin operon repressor/biotin-[acetyl-CoA-carboxylase] ligase
VTSTDREPLDVATINAALASTLAGYWRVRVVAETSSTNEDLLRAAAAQSPGAESANGSVLIAEYQHGGRGRFDRVWTSPRSAGLTISLLLRPSSPVETWGWLSLLAGVALRDALLQMIRTAGGTAHEESVLLKWPNDLLLGPSNKKVAGILVESTADASVIGIGVNVTTSADELPVSTATSLAVERLPADRAAIVIALLTRLHTRLRAWENAGGSAERSGLRAEYRRHCSTVGRRVSVDLPAGVRYGSALDVDETGRLVVRFDDTETVQVVSAGDVMHLETAG